MNTSQSLTQPSIHISHGSPGHLLGLVEAGLGSGGLQQLGGFAGGHTEHSTVGDIAEDAAVPCALRLGRGRGGERAHLLPLHRTLCLLLLLPRLSLHLPGEKSSVLSQNSSHGEKTALAGAPSIPVMDWGWSGGKNQTNKGMGPGWDLLLCSISGLLHRQKVSSFSVVQL